MKVRVVAGRIIVISALRRLITRSKPNRHCWLVAQSFAVVQVVTPRRTAAAARRRDRRRRRGRRRRRNSGCSSRADTARRSGRCSPTSRAKAGECRSACRRRRRRTATAASATTGTAAAAGADCRSTRARTGRSNVGGQIPMLSPQVCGGGTQKPPKQHCPSMHMSPIGQAPPPPHAGLHRHAAVVAAGRAPAVAATDGAARVAGDSAGLAAGRGAGPVRSAGRAGRAVCARDAGCLQRGASAARGEKHQMASLATVRETRIRPLLQRSRTVRRRGRRRQHPREVIMAVDIESHLNEQRVFPPPRRVRRARACDVDGGLRGAPPRRAGRSREASGASRRARAGVDQALDDQVRKGLAVRALVRRRRSSTCRPTASIATSRARGDKPALIWEGEPGDARTLTYRELHAEVCRAANALTRARRAARATASRSTCR